MGVKNTIMLVLPEMTAKSEVASNPKPALDAYLPIMAVTNATSKNTSGNASDAACENANRMTTLRHAADAMPMIIFRKKRAALYLEPGACGGASRVPFFI
jgi:hypothetical protein